jgi:hypothetical protein
MIRGFFVVGALFAAAGGNVASAQDRDVSSRVGSVSDWASSWDASRSAAIALFHSKGAAPSSPSGPLLGTVSNDHWELVLTQRPGALGMDKLATSTRALRRTYWLEGGVGGAIGLGLLTAVLFHGLCESQNCTGSTVGGAVLGGGLGFTVGALVGGQFPKGANATASAPLAPND